MEGEAQAYICAMRSHSAGHGRAYRRDEDDGLLSGHFGGQEINEVGNVGPRSQSQGGPPDPALKDLTLTPRKRDLFRNSAVEWYRTDGTGED